MTFPEQTDALPAHNDTVNFRLAAPAEADPAYPTPTSIPHFLGRFRVLGEIARGGMGVVLRAYDADLDRELAVKLLSPDIAAESEAGRRFAQEARVVSQLHHPGIIAVYEAGTLFDGRPYFAMPFVKGRTLCNLLTTRPTPGHDLDQCLRAFSRVCEAIAHAHREGFVHRDLKPANVMLGPFGEVFVMDWGVAAPIGPATADVDGYWVFGTPAYMPPEQARGHGPADPRGDVFGLGAILCEILTGHPPYLGPDVASVSRLAAAGDQSELESRLDACAADPTLVDLVRRCLSTDPADRPPEAGEIGAAIVEYLAAREYRAAS